MVFGLDVAEAVFRRLDPLVRDRAPAPGGGVAGRAARGRCSTLEGDARALLTGERMALNFLAHLSGIATATAACVHELRGTGVKVLDTRKTTPGLRALEKQAVAAGGGQNHRMGLYDAILVKDNHIALAGGIGEADAPGARAAPAGRAGRGRVRLARGRARRRWRAGAERLLLDNMDPAQLREAAALVAGRAELEASGGITPAAL